MKAFQISGWTSVNELKWLAAQAAHAKVIVEIGTWKGRSAAALAERSSGVVFCIDHFRGSPGEPDAFAEAATPAGRDRVKQECLGNLGEWIRTGRLFVIEQEVQQAFTCLAPVLASRPADLVFVDGCHVFEQVRQDLLSAQSILRKDGLLCGHDRNRKEIVDALNELVPGWKAGPGLLWYR